MTPATPQQLLKNLQQVQALNRQAQVRREKEKRLIARAT
jgi:hypothetical protein